MARPADTVQRSGAARKAASPPRADDDLLFQALAIAVVMLTIATLVTWVALAAG